MFKKVSFENELLESFENNLENLNNQYNIKKANHLNNAIEFIRVASNLLDDVGLEKEANKLTSLLTSLANEKFDSLGNKITDPSTENLTSERMVENEKEKGWVFNADDELEVSEESNNCGYCGDSMDDHDALFCSEYCANAAWDNGLVYDCQDDNSMADDTNDARKCKGYKKSPVGSPRQRAFCKRHCGMKKKLTSKEVAEDPDSCINQGLRRWKCRCS